MTHTGLIGGARSAAVRAGRRSHVPAWALSHWIPEEVPEHLS